MWIQNYAKSCCHKANLGNYFDNPPPPTGSLRYACVYIAARRLDYCTQEEVLSQRAAKCGLHNSVKTYIVEKSMDWKRYVIHVVMSRTMRATDTPTYGIGGSISCSECTKDS